MTRRQRQRLMALTPRPPLEAHWTSLGVEPSYRCVRGRMGGSGNAFNLEEMTLTRASVALHDGTLGHGWVRGRDHRHAELIALVHACAEQLRLSERIDAEMMPTIAEALETESDEASRHRQRASPGCR